jgi:hypothetical protein
MRKLIFLIMIFPAVALASGNGHHHGHEETVNNYSVVNKYVNSYGLAAVHAANQIHPSENISGLQLGAGISQVNDRTGGAIGAAFNFQGLGLVSGSIAKEGDETIWGAGFNFSLKP